MKLCARVAQRALRARMSVRESRADNFNKSRYKSRHRRANAELLLARDVVAACPRA